MNNRLAVVASRSIATWGANHELASVQEAIGGAVAAIAYCQRMHGDHDELAEAAAELTMAAETLTQIAGAIVVRGELERALDAQEAEIQLARASRVPMGGAA